MSPSEIIATISVCIAVLALVQSWRATHRTSQATREANDLLRRQLELQDRLARIEQSRDDAKFVELHQAELRAELRKTDRQSWRLVVTNVGKCTARNVLIRLDDKPLLEHPAIPQAQKEATLIGPGSEISYITVIGFTKHPPFEFSATWEDESGKPGECRTTLTL